MTRLSRNAEGEREAPEDAEEVLATLSRRILDRAGVVSLHGNRRPALVYGRWQENISQVEGARLHSPRPLWCAVQRLRSRMLTVARGDREGIVMWISFLFPPTPPPPFFM